MTDNLKPVQTSGSGNHGAVRRKSLHWVWKFLLTVYFLIGFIYLGSRWFITTHIDDYRDRITETISSAAGIDLRASKFSVGFRYIWPTFRMNDVQLARKGGPVSLVLPTVSGELSWSSLWHLEPRFRHLSVIDPSLTITRLSDTRFDIAGFVLQLPAKDGKEALAGLQMPADGKMDSRFSAWLLGHEKLELLNGTITYVDPNEEKPIRITGADAVLSQSLFDWRAAIEGTTFTDQIGRDFKIRSEITKNLFSVTSDPMSWKGRMYVYFEKTNVARLIQKFRIRNLISSGTASAEMWLDFDRGDIVASTADISLADVNVKLKSSLEPLKIKWLSTRLEYAATTGKASEKTLKISGLDFLTDHNERLGKTDVIASLHTDSGGQIDDGSFTASRLDLKPIASIARRLPIPENYRSFLADHSPTGKISDIRVELSGTPYDPEHWSASASFEELSFPSGKDGLPGFSGLSGSVYPNKETGGATIALNSRNVLLSFPGVFRRPDIRIDRIVSSADLDFSPDLTLTIRSLEASNHEASIMGSGTWIKNGPGPGTLNITGTLDRASAEAVPFYIPRNLGEHLLDWLESGILDGDISQGTYIVRGPLSSFPWDDENKGKGLFRIAAVLKNGELDFLPSHEKNGNGQWKTGERWPILSNIDADLLFEGNSMLVTGRRAESLGMTASDVLVKIPSYITDSRLLVSGLITGDLKDTLGYVKASSHLSEILSDAFRESTGSGPAELALNLEMPFSNPSAIRVGVDLSLDNVDFSYGHGIPTAMKTSGKIKITEKSVDAAEPLTGETAGGPLSVGIKTADGRIDIQTKGIITAEEIEKFLSLDTAAPFFKKVSGKTPVSVDTVIGLQSPGLSVTGESDLTGIESTLPFPFGKKASSPLPLAFSWLPHESGHALNVRSQNLVDLTLLFERQNEKLFCEKGVIAIGPQTKPAIGETIDVFLASPTVDFSAWLPFIRSVYGIVDKMPDAAEGPTLFERIGIISANVGELSWNGEKYKPFAGDFQRFNRRDWHLRLTSPSKLVGQATFEESSASHRDMLSANFAHLHLPESDDSSAAKKEDEKAIINSLPDLLFSVDDLWVGKKNFGSVNLNAGNTRKAKKERWRIREMSIVNPGGTLSASGEWLLDKNGPGTTSLYLTISLKDMGKVLETLAVQDAVRGAPTHAKAALAWKGSPFTPQIDTLSGTVYSESGSGSFLQVEPGAGRILSLLSLQHLLHRLTLDFRDVLSKGFTFDSLLLSGTIENGIFETPKTTVFGSSASVVIGGRINLINEELNLKAIILPSINTGGPTLALALVNPAVGIGTFLTQMIFKDKISDMFRMEYDISGNIDAPVVTKLETATVSK